MRPTAAARSVKALVEANASHNVYTNGITAINLPAAGKAARVRFIDKGSFLFNAHFRSLLLWMLALDTKPLMVLEVLPLLEIVLVSPTTRTLDFFKIE